MAELELTLTRYERDQAVMKSKDGEQFIKEHFYNIWTATANFWSGF